MSAVTRQGRAPSAVQAIGLRWIPPDSSLRRVRAAIALNLVPAIVAVVLFALLPLRSSWADPAMLAALAAIAALAYFAEVNLKLPPAGFFDASIVLALLTLALAGPVPALLVWLVPEAMARVVTRRVKLLTPGFVATATSFALALLAGEAVLALATAPSRAATAPALYTAGLLMWAVNFTVARLFCTPFYYGFRPRALVRSEFLDLAPLVLAMLVVAVVTWLLISPLGLGALAPLALVILLPQVALAHLAAARSVASLAAPEAALVYGAAIADVLRLSRRERRVLALTIRLASGHELDRDELILTPFADVREAAFVALHLGERWDGEGWPAGLRGQATPRLSRAATVALAWGELTARGTAELSHTQALLDLEARAGTEFDPAVVRAALQVVRDEELYVTAPSFEPKLHRLPLPRALRRRAVPPLFARLAGAG